MTNDSSTGGYLIATNAAELNDDNLEDFFNDLFVGLTGLDANLIRPRWTPAPANVPARGVNWIAQGIEDRRVDTYPSQWFEDGVGLHVHRNEELDILVSVYGDHCEQVAASVRDGISIDQNREFINAHGVSLVKCGSFRPTPEVVNMLWYKRVDFILTFRRSIERIYPVLSILSTKQTVTTNRT